MSQPQSEIDALRSQLEAAIQKVPFAVQNGSIQVTQAWLVAQQKAVKLLNKKGAKLTDLRTSLDQVSGRYL